MIDIHVHVLPGVDDGPRTLEEGVAMCRLAAADGVETLVVTPHQRHELWANEEPAALTAACSAVQERLGGAPRLLLGAEIRVDGDLLDLLAGDGGRSVVPLAGSHYLLLEFPPFPTRLPPSELAQELAIAGWRPIVAHPERIPWLAEDPAALEALVAAGALLQVTGSSVTGGMGRGAAECCEWLLDRQLVHFIGSDGHNLHARPPLLSPAFRAVAAGWGEGTAQRLLCENPARVVADAAIPGGG
ncbi:MAG: tyrosine protein phosphatase [Thermoanaerobaculaceae bacterium]|nr:tyrosine protein phosphatase [Thermoanaerobaculaceae bacterium]